MLYLSRKIGESIVINNSIELTIVEIRGKTVKIGFDFPPEATVLRKEIYEKIQLNTKGKIDIVTIYRTIEFFSHENIINKITFADNIIKYELNNTDNHHHHMLCEKCGKIIDFSVDDEDFLSKITKKTHFILRRHSLELWGFCLQCS